jgi:hypothetical protein
MPSAQLGRAGFSGLDMSHEPYAGPCQEHNALEETQAALDSRRVTAVCLHCYFCTILLRECPTVLSWQCSSALRPQPYSHDLQDGLADLVIG